MYYTICTVEFFERIVLPCSLFVQGPRAVEQVDLLMLEDIPEVATVEVSARAMLPCYGTTAETRTAERADMRQAPGRRRAPPEPMLGDSDADDAQQLGTQWRQP